MTNKKYLQKYYTINIKVYQMFLHFLINVIYLTYIINVRGVNMKKILILILTFCALLTFTGCGETILQIDGYYWHKNPMGWIADYKEELEYRIDLTKNTRYNSSEVENADIQMVIDSENSSYKATVESVRENGVEAYKYTTVTKMIGSYIEKVENGVEYPFNDLIETKCVFKGSSLEPLYSEKIVKSTSLIQTNEGYAVVELDFSYVVTYSGKNATVTFTENKDESNILDIETEKVYKDVLKNTYVDNEVILFAPRGYNIAGKENFSVAFNSLDVISKKVRSVYFTSNTGDESKAVSVECNANINNEDRAVQTVRVAVALSGTFTGANIECYYATQDGDRKRLIECYTKVNDNLGYLKYSLKTVSVTE